MAREQLLRKLPKIDELLRRDDIAAVAAPRWAVVEAARRQVDALRKAILAGTSEDVTVEASAVEGLARALSRPSLRRVVNATGVVLHTNLGRAPLADEVMARAAELAHGYSNLEYDIDAGRRGSRHGHIAELVCELVGAEDAVAVNNCAGAVMLGLAAMAHGREVIVSRGELIEIGGSFRIPDVMRLSGARLVEVGTTNKTHPRDYRAAITDDTALLLKVHRSNFAIVGFTVEVEATELVGIGAERGVKTMMDLGSGLLMAAEDLVAMGMPPEPSVRSAVESGLDLVLFSGDKLLGGPQAGILAGKADAVAACRKHPLMRALRPDKLTIAALEATLSLYRDGRARDAVPAVAMLSTPLEALRQRAADLVGRIGDVPEWLTVDLTPCESTVGGGTMPTARLPSWGVGLAGGDTVGPDALDARLRAGDVPVIGHIVDDTLVLDVRTMREDELDIVSRAVQASAVRR